MDVVCDRCKTEYEFDDALVSERGTTVKCTNCGHQFKIYRSASDPDAARVWNLRRPDGTVIPFDSLAVLQKWILEGRVSKTDEIARTGESWKSLGAIAELESFFATADLRATQQPSTAGSSSNRPPATRTTTGGFRVPPPPGTPVLRTNTRPGVSGAPSTGSTLRPPAGPPPVPNLPPPSRGNSVRGPLPPPPPGDAAAPKAPGAPAAKPALPPPDGAETYDIGQSTPAVEDGFALGETRRSDRPPWSDGAAPTSPHTSPQTSPQTSPRARPAIGPPPRQVPAARDEGPPVPRDARRNLSLDEEPTTSVSPDEVHVKGMPRKRGGSGGIFLGLGLGLLLAGGAFAAVRLGLIDTGRAPAPTPGVTPTPSPAETQVPALLEHARQVARKGTRASYEDAREELTRALALAPDDARVLARRAEVMAAWSELLRQRADDLEARAGRAASPAAARAEAAAMRAEAAVLRREASERAERARGDWQAAQQHVDRAPVAERPEVHAALADVARVLGDVPAARRHAEAAREAASPEAALAAALLDRDTGASPQARERLQAVVGRAGDLARARVALARMLAANGDAAGASNQLGAVLQTYPGHEDAQALTQALARNEPPMQRGAAVAQAPTTPTESAPATPDAGAAAPTAPTNTAANATPTAPGEGERGERGGRNYDALVAEGERLQSDGHVAQARERFQRALAVRPNGAEALTGMAYVELDRRNYSTAIARFREALASNPSYSEALIGLGEAYSSQGNYRQALNTYQQYLQVNPGGSRAGMARRQIESLQRRLGAQQEEPSPGSNGTTGPSEPRPAPEPEPRPEPRPSTGTTEPAPGGAESPPGS